MRGPAMAAVFLLAACGSSADGEESPSKGGSDSGGASGAEVGGSAGATSGSGGRGGSAGSAGAASGTGGTNPNGGAGGAGASSGAGGDAGAPGGSAGDAAGGNGAGAGGDGAGAGDGGAGPGSCAAATTLAECDAKDDCHSVFVDPQGCGCAALGCCARFSFCANGNAAVCDAMITCRRAAPYCEGPYVISYVGTCYEGCVRATECDR